MVRHAAWRALAAFAVYRLLTDPDGAAGLVHGLLDGLGSAGHSLSSFVIKL